MITSAPLDLLIEHVKRFYYSPSPESLNLGKEEDLLSLRANIRFSKKISDCFDNRSNPIGYPTELKERRHIVACCNRGLYTEVIAVYNLDQMKKIDSLKSSALVLGISWKILRVPKKIKAIVDGQALSVVIGLALARYKES
jgi:hypothetical protein